MKKILLTIILGIFLVSFISAENISIQYGQNESDGGIIPIALDNRGWQLINLDFANFTGRIAQFKNITVTDTLTSNTFKLNLSRILDWRDIGQFIFGSEINNDLNWINVTQGNTAGFNSTFNATYDEFAYNQSDGSFNATYDAKADYLFGSNNFNGSGNMTTVGKIGIDSIDMLSKLNIGVGSVGSSWDVFVNSTLGGIWVEGASGINSKAYGVNGISIRGDSFGNDGIGVYGLGTDDGSIGVRGISQNGTAGKFTSSDGVALLVEGFMNVTGNVSADFFFGDGSSLTGISGGIWTNASGTATYEGNVNITQNLTVGQRLGIGTASPAAELHIDKDTAAASAKLRIENGDGAVDIATDNTNMFLQAPGATNRITILGASGNVGIGTTSPDGALDVQGDGKNIRLQSDDHIVGFLGVSGSGAALDKGFFELYSEGTSKVRFRADAADSYINSGGGLAIGKTSTTFQLELSTNSAGKPTSNVWTIVSDERVKTNVQNYTEGLDLINQIRPIKYEYNGKAEMVEEGDLKIGIIAQELQQVAPYMIGTFNTKLNLDDKEDTELLSYDGHAMTFILINAIKELYHKYLDQQTEIDNLKSENTLIKQTLCSMNQTQWC